MSTTEATETEQANHRRHFSMMLDLAEHPNGNSMGEWGWQFPPTIVKAMLSVVQEASALTELLSEGDDYIESEHAMEVWGIEMNAAEDNLTAAVAAFWTTLAEPIPHTVAEPT